MKIKIAVCDSDKQVLDYLRDMIIRQQPAAEVKTFSSAEGLLQSETEYAIYILDVEGVGGMEIASILRSREQAARSIIIFVTGYREYMPAAFDVQAFHYVNLIIGYLAFRYMEVILTGRFAKRRTALWGWLAVYTAGQTGISWGIDALGGSQAGAYGGMVQLIPCALLLLMLQKYYFHRNWPRQIFALASFIAGWAVLRFAVSPLSYVLFDFWHPLWNWLVEYSVAQGLISSTTASKMPWKHAERYRRPLVWNCAPITRASCSLSK